LNNPGLGTVLAKAVNTSYGLPFWVESGSDHIFIATLRLDLKQPMQQLFIWITCRSINKKHPGSQISIGVGKMGLDYTALCNVVNSVFSS